MSAEVYEQQLGQKHFEWFEGDEAEFAGGCSKLNCSSRGESVQAVILEDMDAIADSRSPIAIKVLRTE